MNPVRKDEALTLPMKCISYLPHIEKRGFPSNGVKGLEGV